MLLPSPPRSTAPGKTRQVTPRDWWSAEKRDNAIGQVVPTFHGLFTVFTVISDDIKNLNQNALSHEVTMNLSTDYYSSIYSSVIVHAAFISVEHTL